MKFINAVQKSLLARVDNVCSFAPSNCHPDVSNFNYSHSDNFSKLGFETSTSTKEGNDFVNHSQYTPVEVCIPSVVSKSVYFEYDPLFSSVPQPTEMAAAFCKIETLPSSCSSTNLNVNNKLSKYATEFNEDSSFVKITRHSSLTSDLTSTPSLSFSKGIETFSQNKLKASEMLNNKTDSFPGGSANAVSQEASESSIVSKSVYFEYDPLFSSVPQPREMAAAFCKIETLPSSCSSTNLNVNELSKNATEFNEDSSFVKIARHSSVISDLTSTSSLSFSKGIETFSPNKLKTSEMLNNKTDSFLGGSANAVSREASESSNSNDSSTKKSSADKICLKEIKVPCLVKLNELLKLQKHMKKVTKSSSSESSEKITSDDEAMDIIQNKCVEQDSLEVWKNSKTNTYVEKLQEASESSNSNDSSTKKTGADKICLKEIKVPCLVKLNELLKLQKHMKKVTKSSSSECSEKITSEEEAIDMVQNKCVEQDSLEVWKNSKTNTYVEKLLLTNTSSYSTNGKINCIGLNDMNKVIASYPHFKEQITMFLQEHSHCLSKDNSILNVEFTEENNVISTCSICLKKLTISFQNNMFHSHSFSKCQTDFEHLKCLSLPEHLFIGHQQKHKHESEFHNSMKKSVTKKVNPCNNSTIHPVCKKELNTSVQKHLYLYHEDYRLKPIENRSLNSLVELPSNNINVCKDSICPICKMEITTSFRKHLYMKHRKCYELDSIVPVSQCSLNGKPNETPARKKPQKNTFAISSTNYSVNEGSSVKKKCKSDTTVTLLLDASKEKSNKSTSKNNHFAPITVAGLSEKRRETLSKNFILPEITISTEIIEQKNVEPTSRKCKSHTNAPIFLSALDEENAKSVPRKKYKRDSAQTVIDNPATSSSRYEILTGLNEDNSFVNIQAPFVENSLLSSVDQSQTLLPNNTKNFLSNSEISRVSWEAPKLEISLASVLGNNYATRNIIAEDVSFANKSTHSKIYTPASSSFEIKTESSKVSPKSSKIEAFTVPDSPENTKHSEQISKSAFENSAHVTSNLFNKNNSAKELNGINKDGKTLVCPFCNVEYTSNQKHMNLHYQKYYAKQKTTMVAFDSTSKLCGEKTSQNKFTKILNPKLNSLGARQKIKISSSKLKKNPKNIRNISQKLTYMTSNNSCKKKISKSKKSAHLNNKVPENSDIVNSSHCSVCEKEIFGSHTEHFFAPKKMFLCSLSSLARVSLKCTDNKRSALVINDDKTSNMQPNNIDISSESSGNRSLSVIEKSELSENLRSALVIKDGQTSNIHPINADISSKPSGNRSLSVIEKSQLSENLRSALVIKDGETSNIHPVNADISSKPSGNKSLAVIEKSELSENLRSALVIKDGETSNIHPINADISSKPSGNKSLAVIEKSQLSEDIGSIPIINDGKTSNMQPINADISSRSSGNRSLALIEKSQLSKMLHNIHGSVRNRNITPVSSGKLCSNTAGSKILPLVIDNKSSNILPRDTADDSSEMLHMRNPVVITKSESSNVLPNTRVCVDQSSTQVIFSKKSKDEIHCSNANISLKYDANKSSAPMIKSSMSSNRLGNTAENISCKNPRSVIDNCKPSNRSKFCLVCKKELVAVSLRKHMYMAHRIFYVNNTPQSIKCNTNKK